MLYYLLYVLVGLLIAFLVRFLRGPMALLTWAEIALVWPLVAFILLFDWMMRTEL